jgi:hypothetical protein
MTPPQKTKLRWWVIWLLSVTAGPMLAVSFENSLHWMGLLIVCIVTNLTASFFLMTADNKPQDASVDLGEITKSCLLFLGGLLLIAAVLFVGCLAAIGTKV